MTTINQHVGHGAARLSLSGCASGTEPSGQTQNELRHATGLYYSIIDGRGRSAQAGKHRVLHFHRRLQHSPPVAKANEPVCYQRREKRGVLLRSCTR